MVRDQEPERESAQLSARAEQDGEVWPGQVRPGESAGLVAAYREAVAIAAQVRAALDRAGISATDAVVVPSLTDAGRPVAWLTLTPRGRRRLASQTPDCGSGPYPLIA